MPWVPVDDPNELQVATSSFAVNTTEGKGKTGAQEAKTMETSQEKNQTLRGLIGMLTRAEMFNRRLPTGRFEARMNGVNQEFPKSWQSGDVANFQGFQGLQQRMLKPSMSLGGAGNVSSGEVNTPKELEMAMTAVPGPGKEDGANRYLTNSVGELALQQFSRNVFMEKWRAMYGSSHALSKTGKSAEEAFAAFLNSPKSAPLRKPLTTYVDEAAARQKGKTAPEPKVGQIVDGYRFNGGDKRSPASWTKM